MLCVCVSVLLPLPLPLALTVNAFGLRCSRSYYVHFVPQLPQRVARSRCLSFSLALHPSLLSCTALSVCFFHRTCTGWVLDDGANDSRAFNFNFTFSSVRPELLPLPACGKVLLPRCLLALLPAVFLLCCYPFPRDYLLIYQLVCNTLAKALAAGLCDKEPENLLDCVIELQEDITVIT